MSDERDSDHHLPQTYPSDTDHFTNLNHPSGRAIRYQGQGLCAQDKLRKYWYPGFEFHQSAEPTMSARKEHPRADDHQDILQQTADVGVNIRVFGVGGAQSKPMSLMGMCELAARTTQAAALEVNGVDSEFYERPHGTGSTRPKSKRWSLLRGFDRLGRYVRVSSRSVMSTGVNIGSAAGSFIAASDSAPTLSSAPPFTSPPTPRLTAPEFTPTPPEIIITPPNHPPPLAYRTLPFSSRTPPLPPPLLPTSTSTSTSTSKPSLPLPLPLPLPPPVPQKPAEYQLSVGACRSPIDYEGCVEAKYGDGDGVGVGDGNRDREKDREKDRRRMERRGYCGCGMRGCRGGCIGD